VKTLVLYHRDWDGLVAAWVAKRAWGERPVKLPSDKEGDRAIPIR
jgi:oligoribonuclease NrnB/cAMP/cGMP phosphodiesterase (DHH superfamily)